MRNDILGDPADWAEDSESYPTELTTPTAREIVAWINKLTPEGTYFNHELTRLVNLVRELPQGATICEIGVYGGRTAAVYLLEQIRRMAIYATLHDDYSLSGYAECALETHLIDSWVLNQNDSKPCFYSVVQAAMELCDDLGVSGPLYEAHWVPSADAAPEIPSYLDLLHIDGDHDRGAWIDIELYVPKLAIGGWLVVHDYGKPDEYPEVTKAVDALLARKPESWDVLPVVGSQFAARRLA